MVLVGESGLSLYAKGDGRSWTRTDAAIPLESQPPAAQDTFKAVDAAPYDTERNGIPKIIVLLAGSKGSRLQIFEVQSSGSLLPKETINFPAVQVRKMLVADLDADGKPEILVSHPATTFIPSA